jgi:hypothetical protein
MKPVKFVTPSNGLEVAVTDEAVEPLLELIPPNLEFSSIATGTMFRAGKYKLGHRRSVDELQDMFLLTLPTKVQVCDASAIAHWEGNLGPMKVEPYLDNAIYLRTRDDNRFKVEVIFELSSETTRDRLIDHLTRAVSYANDNSGSTSQGLPTSQPTQITKSQFIDPHVEWPNTIIHGDRITQKTNDAILRHCHNDQPWFMLSTSGGGVLAAFDDRLAIIKTGAITTLAAGSLGGERSETFYYRDITGIKYNSNIVVAYIEIINAGHDGTRNPNFWNHIGRNPAPIKDTPWTLSNTLPLSKAIYNTAIDEIKELRVRIAKSKDLSVNVNVDSSQQQNVASVSIVDELTKLAALQESGHISDDEFNTIKLDLMKRLHS